MSEHKEHRFVRLIAIVAVASIAVLPLTIYGCGPEWARWDAAQANMYFRQGETDDAIYQLRDAIRKSPRDPVLKLTLAERLIEIDKHAEAMDLANQVLAVFPDNSRAVAVISKAQQDQGDFKAALKTNLDFNGQSYRRSISGLNELAYNRALARVDLPQAKEDIESVVKSGNRYISWTGDDDLDFGVKATILAAMVSRCCEGQDEAIKTISLQVDSIFEYITTARKQLTNEVYELAQDSFPVRQDKATLKSQQILEVFERRAAALLSCRALLYQDLNDMGRCESDRREVMRLGFDSSEILNDLPDERIALLALGAPTAYLDTRGYICGLLTWDDDLTLQISNARHEYSTYEKAVRDMNIAILCSEVSLKSLDYPLGNSIEFNEGNKQFTEKESKRLCAVLRYHRMKIHERAGKYELARLDAKRIRELGDEPGPHLY